MNKRPYFTFAVPSYAQFCHEVARRQVPSRQLLRVFTRGAHIYCGRREIFPGPHYPDIARNYFVTSLVESLVRTLEELTHQLPYSLISTSCHAHESHEMCSKEGLSPQTCTSMRRCDNKYTSYTRDLSVYSVCAHIISWLITLQDDNKAHSSFANVRETISLGFRT